MQPAGERGGRGARHARVGAEAVQRRGPAGRRWRRCRRWRRRTSPRRSPPVAADAAYDCGDYAAAASGPGSRTTGPQGPCQASCGDRRGGGGWPCRSASRPPAPHDLRPGDPLNARPVLVEQGGAPLAGRGDLPTAPAATASGPGRTRAGGSPANSPSPGTALRRTARPRRPFTLDGRARQRPPPAVIGYDSVRGTLLIRDYERNAREFLCDKLIERYKSSGPRGMAIVPADKASLLEGLDLPDADLHDRLFAVTDALVRYKARRGGRGLRGHAGRRPRPPADPPGPPIHRRLRQQPDRDPPVRRRGARPLRRP